MKFRHQEMKDDVTVYGIVLELMQIETKKTMENYFWRADCHAISLGNVK
jgi:hypothetical protein